MSSMLLSYYILGKLIFTFLFFILRGILDIFNYRKLPEKKKQQKQMPPQ